MAGHCIAIIDDDEAFREFMRDVLTDEGYRVITVDAPAVALELLRAERPDLLILDLRLGAMLPGMEILQAMRAEPAFAALPVIVCTAALDLLARFAADLRALNAEVLAKPFALDDLLARVTALIGPANGDYGTHTSNGGAA